VPPLAGLAAISPACGICCWKKTGLTKADLAPMRNLVAALFQLEHSRGPEELQQVVERLVEWLQPRTGERAPGVSRSGCARLVAWHACRECGSTRCWN